MGRSSNLRPFALPRSYAAGCFLCTSGPQARYLVHKKHNIHQSTSGPLPCTIEAITRSGTDTPSSRPTGPFSPNVGEEEFCELRGSKVDFEVAVRGIGVGQSGLSARYALRASLVSISASQLSIRSGWG